MYAIYCFWGAKIVGHHTKLFDSMGHKHSWVASQQHEELQEYIQDSVLGLWSVHTGIDAHLYCCCMFAPVDDDGEHHQFVAAQMQF